MSQSEPRAGLFSPLGARRSSDRVADVIRRTIFDGEFRPGDRLPTERTLAERFQVTRNTVREALRQLEQHRMVKIRQGSGVVVLDLLATAGIDALAVLLGSEALGGKLVRDVLEVRVVVGRAIAAFAIERFDRAVLQSLRHAVEAFEEEALRPAPDPAVLRVLDFDVHTRLVQGSGNVALVLLFNSLRTVTERVPHLLESLVARPDRLATLYRQTITALEQDDRPAAAEAFEKVFEAELPAPSRRRTR